MRPPNADTHDQHRASHRRQDSHQQAHGHAHGHAQMLRQWIWRDFVNITLGFWLLAAPFTMGHYWSSPKLACSDFLSGAAAVILGTMTLFPRFDLARWGLCTIGLWLFFAPLVFWTPSPGAYNNDLLVGALLITFSVLVPMMPSRTHHTVMMTPGPDIPPGWSYNPSEWAQRGPIIAMAFLGFFLSRYLAAYQLEHVPTAWDPAFGDGTRRVLESDVSRAWPISDAGLGASAYMIEALSGFMGGKNRWRTMPWMVLMFGILVVPLGIVSIVLVILQPVAVGSWCFLCLVTAAAMLIMISPALDEVIAMLQYLRAARREGQSVWRIFWTGGTLKHDTGPSRAVPQSPAASAPLLRRIFAGLDLNNVPWNLLIAAAIGIWLMAAPAVLGITGTPAKSDQLLGALIVTFTVIAFSEIARPARWLNLLFALWLLIAPWIFSTESAAWRWNDIIVALALIALSIRRGRIEEHFAGWNRYLV